LPLKADYQAAGTRTRQSDTQRAASAEGDADSSNRNPPAVDAGGTVQFQIGAADRARPDSAWLEDEHLLGTGDRGEGLRGCGRFLAEKGEATHSEQSEHEEKAGDWAIHGLSRHWSRSDWIAFAGGASTAR
jgi:hypothetical protein